ncbi:hypothetical protein EST62_10200 [Chlorobaculum sp. 24CR]|uniref:hypothetical protein n=1 Tax=Chlorobaculum sp. 24CR TaxID=2508878 RepID=UPI00100BD5A5|nr:hypothetical protein [Chlorobaculum sp. 24CR]RXK82738.1 hypothetical protein EST62_10200 [Chlorobaculum sp. 24CR]
MSKKIKNTMKFKNINSDTDCDCTSKAEIDSSNEYVRKLRKDKVEDKDFQTHWERGIRAENEDCDIICSYKAVSINQIKPEYENLILEKYKTTFNFNKKKGSYYLKFRFNKDAGKVIYSPEEDDKSHYNFYKADDFNLGKIVVMETVKFA